MKKILTISLMFLAGIVLLSSCTKTDYYDDWQDDNNDESGIVKYISEVNSPYSVVKMDYDGQYAVIYSVDKDVKLWPENNDVLIGDFTVGGNRKVYNKTIGKSINIEVDEFFKYQDDAIHSVIRKEDSEGYSATFKKSPILTQRRTGLSNIIIK
ncbi:MAG: hypothetical protein E6Q58_02860 [Niabella sp.]|nr:MAG: hypothetical protein E6Q58_02860 [Niabella sp.]